MKGRGLEGLPEADQVMAGQELYALCFMHGAPANSQNPHISNIISLCFV